ncbi:hypothetical protein VI817_005801 [Penicillium citrinum]|nr:hypothetical protein VI817_005801 [Penicillium citrinum]
MAGSFLAYHEPGIVDILIIVSFFFFLSLAEWVSAKIIRAGIIGQIAVGIIYGEPLANILKGPWQETFLAVGYIGLILIIFEGGLQIRLDLLKKNFLLSVLGAATGVCFPIGLSYLLLYLGYGYGAVETFIAGSALSATSLGTTFSVISSASKEVDLSQTRVGSVLVSAAVIDDVVGLVLASLVCSYVLNSVIHDLGGLSDSGSGSPSLGWIIGRPIVASAAMAIATPILTKFVFAPIFRRWIEHSFAKYDHLSNITLMVLVLSAFISIAAYAGTSVLFGAFLAGAFLTYLPSKHPDGPFVVMSREEGEREADKSPTFVHTFERYLLDVQRFLMEPLFFASVGFAIPFLKLWTGKRIWRGILYSLLMAFAKFIVGIWIPIWEALFPQPSSKGAVIGQHNNTPKKSNDTPEVKEKKRDYGTSSIAGFLLGSAMVARGEIGLLIIEVGYNETSYVSQDGFITAVWAILLNTIIGPITVGYLVKFLGKKIGTGKWGLQDAAPSTTTD